MTQTSSSGLRSPRAHEIEGLTRSRIDLYQKAGRVWRFAESLKAIAEDTAQEYEGRALLELVQNGHDALSPATPGRIKAILDLTHTPGTLYVANDGDPFAAKDFASISEFALSSKGAGEGIGNKGLGFRSVLQLSDWPGIYSRHTPSSAGFDGYCFRFAEPDDLRALLGDGPLLHRVLADVSPLALPIPADSDDPVIAELADDGYATVVRLPLRDDHAAALALEQIDGLADDDAPLLLFLDRISRLHAETRTAAETSTRTLTRLPRAPRLLAYLEDDWAEEVDLAETGTYLLARRQLDPGPLTDAIRDSVRNRDIDKRWNDWDGRGAHVAVALRLDQPLRHGRLYTFLPMSAAAAAPMRAHAHAPFFTLLARGNINDKIALNSHLLDQIAALTVDLLRRVRDQAPHADAARHVPDLACWTPHDRLDAALAGALADEPITPLIGRRWGSLNSAFHWPAGKNGWSELTAAAIARTGSAIADAEAAGPDGVDGLLALHQAVLGTSMHANPQQRAAWAENVAGRLPLPPSGRTAITGHARWAQRWAAFYDDLHQAFAHDPAALRGMRIVLDHAGKVQRALGSDPPTAPTLFFSPGDEPGTAAVDRVPSDLRALHHRIAFTHPALDWARPTRSFLETHQLVREYRADRVFDALRDLLSGPTTDALRRDALTFAWRQFDTLPPSQRAALPAVGLFVPLQDGTWARADTALLSPGWEAEGALRLDRFLNAGGDAVPELAALRRRWTAGPAAWPAGVGDQPGAYREFLTAIGVRDGLLLAPLDQHGHDRYGGHLKPAAIAREHGLDPALAREWAADVAAAGWNGGSHPQTMYGFAPPPQHLPGAAVVENLGDRARAEFGELLLWNLAHWPGTAFHVKVLRRTRAISQQDPHTWPTPLLTYLRHRPWLPLAASDGQPAEFVPPPQAWISGEGDVPPYVPSLSLNARKLLADDRAAARVRLAGLRMWEDPTQAAAAVRDLGDLLAADAVPQHQNASFKKQYARAFGHVARAGAWPWDTLADVRLATVRAGRLAATPHRPDEPVYLVDETAPLKESLVELAGHPVLVSDPADGAAAAALLAANSTPTVLLSATDVSVRIRLTAELLAAGTDHPPLVAAHPSLPVVAAAVLELKSGTRFRTERTQQAFLERLRTIRIARVDDVDILIDGTPTRPPDGTRSVPLADANHPTVVAWRTDGPWDEAQACAGSLCQLLGQSSLRDALELVLSKLEKLTGGDPDAVDDDLLARAADSTPERVAEIRSGMDSHHDDVVRRLRPVLICLSGPGSAPSVGHALAAATTDPALAALLAPHADRLPCTADEALAAVRGALSFAEVRDGLALDFRQFNRALSELDPPHPPLTHPDLHDETFGRFVDSVRPVLVERLRERYKPLAEAGHDASGYAAGRRLDDLVRDPGWLLQARVPDLPAMRARAQEWLRGHGADPDLDSPGRFPPPETTRSASAEALRAVVDSAVPVVRAWCRLHGAQPPAPWAGAPLLEAQAALDAAGLADLIVVDDARLLATAAAGAGWPPGMRVTLDMDELGLTPADLAPGPDGGGRSGRDRTTIKIGAATVLVGAAHLAQIAEAALQTVTDDFLAQNAKTGLDPLAPASTRGKKQTPRNTAVAGSPRMTEDERTAVGLVGEIAARAWLQNRHEQVLWRSGYALLLTGDTEASDGWGYDFEVVRPRGANLLYEVKATTGPVAGLVEFEMGQSEIDAAQEHARTERYRILLITSVLDPAERSVRELPNPYSPKGRGRYRPVGRGMRYQCAPD